MEGDNKEPTNSEVVAGEGSKENNDGISSEEITNGDDENITHTNGNNAGNNVNNHYRAAPVVGSPPPHWVPMQYPAMMMPIPQPYPHILHYARQNHHHAPPPHSPGNGRGTGPSNNGENRTIWVGDLNIWMDEDYLRNCFGSTAEVSSIKVIRNRQTGFPEGYGFVEFTSHAAAEKILQSYSHRTMPNSDQNFRLNWATFGAGDKRSNNNNSNNNNNSTDLSIFVGDLASDVTDSLLHETFATKYPSVKAAKVVMDLNTGRSKGYGFVRFGDDAERSKAMVEMQGFHCSSRPMRIGPATQRKSLGHQQQYSSSSQGGSSNGAPAQSDGKSANTTIFVGGLDPNVSEEDLKQPFAEYGEIVSVKIPMGKGCGFVQFSNRNDAEEALQQLSGATIGKQTVRLAWGRNPVVNRQPDNNDYGPWWGAPYYGEPYFNGYEYPMMNHHQQQQQQQQPHYLYMYAAASPYPAAYGGHQQQVS